jgi:hypothetical protein
MGGTVGAKLFKVSVGITDFGTPGGPSLVEPNLLVMELTTPLSNLEVLIGLDILLNCKLQLDGPARQFTLEF